MSNAKIIRKVYAIVNVFAADGFGCEEHIRIPSLGIDQVRRPQNVSGGFCPRFDLAKYEVEYTPWVQENPGISRTEYWYEK